MENSNNTKVERVIFPPNKPMDRKLLFSTTPKLYDSLLFMDFNDEGWYLFSILQNTVGILISGNCILGCSNLAGSFWEGTLLYFKDADALNKFDSLGYYIYASTSDGKFISNKIVLLHDVVFHKCFIHLISVSDSWRHRQHKCSLSRWWFQN